ncbi:MAG: hypothetical protein ACOY93_09240 [Bacillota bacterium]
MSTFFAWFFGILFALPVWAGCAILGYVILRLFIQWLTDDGTAPGTKGRAMGGPGATAKG